MNVEIQRGIFIATETTKILQDWLPWIRSVSENEALAALAICVLGASLSHGLGKLYRRAKRKRRSARAKHAEEGAAKLLRSAGFRIIASQPQARPSMRVDGVLHTFTLRADYLVKKGSKRYVAEVKSGRLAPRIDHGPTRRQLLEYAMVYPVDGVLLVDMERRHIRPVSFPYAAKPKRWKNHALLAAALLAPLMLLIRWLNS